VPQRPGPEAAQALAALLVAEMIRRWRQGERPLPEEFLARHPELWEQPEAAADLVYEELCLRQEYGPEVPAEEVLARFPQWRPQLELLLDCQRLLGPPRVVARFPAAGEALGDFLLLAELGRGAHARVFLASQLPLAARPVVLKFTPLGAQEHLSLARLQHTNIVPLYSAQDYPALGLRALCMPYFGGATLAQLLESLRQLPPARRTGRHLLDALPRAQQAQGAARGLQPAQADGGRAAAARRLLLAGAAYPEVLCWIGACLAEALQYAHERGLVHLDLKPSNVLVTADGQPMVLDFHLAREPLDPGAQPPPWMGGTPAYMPPEQAAAMEAVEQGRMVPRAVDGRADVYALGAVLYEALAGHLPQAGDPRRALRRCNPQVSVGLAGVIGKCLAQDPQDRYPQMAALAADLRRHLAHLPLVGIRNSLAERWRKWRRRRPHQLGLAAILLACLTTAGAAGVGLVSHLSGRVGQARLCLADARAQMNRGEWEGAVRTLQRGLAEARSAPWQGDLADELDRALGVAEQGRAAADRSAAVGELQQLADRVRFLYGADHLPFQDLQALKERCAALWEQRQRVAERVSAGGPPEPVVRENLLDLALFWADLQVRLARPAEKDEARRQALAVLDQAEALLGPNPVLGAERTAYGAARQPPGLKVPAVHTAWEHCALGRVLLRAGALERADDELRRAVRLEPQGLWPNFYAGVCAYRLGRYEDAVTAFSVCIGAAPAAACFYNRGLAWVALGRDKQALDDLDQALRLEPALAVAALDRGMLHYRAGRHGAAVADLERARQGGADAALVAYDLALVHLARGERGAALADLRQALRLNPAQPEARKLYRSLFSY
jgi:serine/threonine protein kinase/Flp pilus assembly protein TadD